MPTPEPKRCLGCGYILENLPEPRCPECGRKFDSANSSTYCTQLKSGRKYLFAAISGCLFVAVPASVFGLGRVLPEVVGDWDIIMAFALVALGVSACVIEVVVLLVSADALIDPSHCVRHRGCARAALIISAAFIMTLLCLIAWPVVVS